MKRILVITVLILSMCGIAIADGGYGMMDSNCTNCTDVPCCQVDAPYTEASTASTTAVTTAYTSTLEEWEYGRMNECPDGMDHVYWDFEIGSNLGVFKNPRPDVAVFESVSNSNCCWPCYDINEPSYVRKGASSGPNCRCKMHIYPYNTKFRNGTEMPYISALTGNAAFSPRVMSSWCYWPGCSAFIGFAEGTHYVSFLASTHGTLKVGLYDHKGNQLSVKYIYVNTKRVGDAPPNFTRFSIHLPDQDIGYMTLQGPFNGWNLDELIVGGEFVYMPDTRRDYSYAAERLKQLIGLPYHNFAIGFDLFTQRYFTAEELMDGKEDPYWDKRNRELIWVNGISDEAAIAWAFNGEEFGEIVNWAYINNQFNKDFTEEVAIEDLQPGDVFFIDYPEKDGFPFGFIDEVGMYVGDTVVDGKTYDIIRITPVIDGKTEVCYDTVAWIEEMYAEEGFVDYRCLPDNPKGGHSPYPKIPAKYITPI